MSDDYTPYALVADDDAIIRMDAADILSDAGFRVHEAANVAEAKAILQQARESIQLLFTDVQMPPGELNGFDLARNCHESWPHISILVASGQIKPKDGDLPPGAVFVSKPFSSQVVIDRLAEILPDQVKPEPLKRAVRS
jgi:CheY-like chemotaxis protein